MICELKCERQIFIRDGSAIKRLDLGQLPKLVQHYRAPHAKDHAF